MSEQQRIVREKELRGAVLRGEASAWNAWYDAHFSPLYRFLHFRCGRDSGWTDELAQECWMIAVRRIRDFDPSRTSFEAWLFGIARNVLRNDRRRSRNDTALTEEPMDSDRLSLVTRSELGEQIGLAFTELPMRYQSVLRQRYEQQRTVAEIAESESTTVTAMESLLARARRAFRSAFQRLHGEQGEADER